MSLQNGNEIFNLHIYRFKEFYCSVSEIANVSKNITLTPCLESAVVVFGKIVEISSVYYGIKLELAKYYKDSKMTAFISKRSRNSK